MSPAPVRVGIILYVNRSGSTLLSRMLSESLADTFVFPELRFTLDLLVARRPVATETLLRLMLADPRLASLGISPDRLAAIAIRHGAADLLGLLTSIAGEALGRRPRAMILKLEPYVGLVPQLDAAFATPVLIHALRDPRAVARSMRATPVPEKPGFDMARGSLLHAARHWRNHVARVAALRPVITARYEALDAAIPVIAEALGVAIEPSDSTYAIAPLDAALHCHVTAPYDPSRDDAWRRDLAASDIAMIEAICGPAMDRLGYRRSAAPPGPAIRAAAELRHIAAMARHALLTALGYVHRPRELAARLRLARRIGGF